MFTKKIESMQTTYAITCDHMRFVIAMGHEQPICECYYVRLEIRDLALRDAVWTVPCRDLNHAVAIINTYTEEYVHA